jgi:hypothetical protein
MVRTALLIGREHVCQFIRKSVGSKEYNLVGWSYLKRGVPQTDTTLAGKLTSSHPPVSVVVIGAGLPEPIRQSVAATCRKLAPSARIELRPMPSKEDRERYDHMVKDGRVDAETARTVGPWATIHFLDAVMAQIDKTPTSPQ